MFNNYKINGPESDSKLKLKAYTSHLEDKVCEQCKEKREGEKKRKRRRYIVHINFLILF